MCRGEGFVADQDLTSREAQEFLDGRENTVAGGTAWERIAKLVDLSDKGVRAGRGDKTQFRAMLLSLRKDEKVALRVPCPCRSRCPC